MHLELNFLLISDGEKYRFSWFIITKISQKHKIFLLLIVGLYTRDLRTWNSLISSNLNQLLENADSTHV